MLSEYISESRFYKNIYDPDQEEKIDIHKVDWNFMSDPGKLRAKDIVGNSFQIISDLTSYKEDFGLRAESIG